MPSSMRSRFRTVALAVLGLLWLVQATWAGPRVESVGTNVSDLDRSVAFFTEVLDFEEVSRSEVWGPEWEELSGVFGARLRVAELRLGEEILTLTEYLTPQGRPVPADSRSNDRWFQHVAIVVRDIDAAYARLREHGVRHVSTGPQTLPDWNPNVGARRAGRVAPADRALAQGGSCFVAGVRAAALADVRRCRVGTSVGLTAPMRDRPPGRGSPPRRSRARPSWDRSWGRSWPRPACRCPSGSRPSTKRRTA
jgi:catechol 2,3-dioxygenase-like lactoylglutathione lyase family enzyme